MIKVTKGAYVFLFEFETFLFVSFECKQFWILQSIRFRGNITSTWIERQYDHLTVSLLIYLFYTNEN